MEIEHGTGQRDAHRSIVDIVKGNQSNVFTEPQVFESILLGQPVKLCRRVFSYVPNQPCPSYIYLAFHTQTQSVAFIFLYRCSVILASSNVER